MVIWTQNNEIIQIVGSVVSARNNMVNVYNFIPAANHTLITEVFSSIETGSCAIVCAFKVPVSASFLALSRLPTRRPIARSIEARPAAIFGVCRSVRFDKEGIAAILALLLYTLHHS